MKSTIKKLPKSQIELEIEVPAEEFKHFIEKSTLNLGKDLEIKGFRKGKVPEEIIEKEIGSEKILIEAADLAVKENYRKAILENKIEAIFQPEIKIQKLVRGDSFVFLAKIAVLPEIKLPDYKKITSGIKRKEIIVEEKEINEALNWLQKSRAKFTLKNQPAEIGDFIEIEYWSFQLDGLNQQKKQKDAFILGEGRFIPGFEEKLIGMRAGEEKDGILIDIPKNNSLEKQITLNVKIRSVQNVEFPEINDEFAKNLGKFENLAALKENIKKGIYLEKEQAESQRVRNEILEKISQKVECEIPEVLIEREQKQMLENLKKSVSDNLKISFTDYLSKIKKTEKETLDSFLPQAQKKLKSILILREIGKREKVEASENEITEEVNKILKHYSSANEEKKNLDPVKSHEAGISPKAKLFNGVDLEKLKDYTKEVIITEKVFQLLESLVK